MTGGERHVTRDWQALAPTQPNRRSTLTKCLEFSPDKTVPSSSPVSPTPLIPDSQLFLNSGAS